MCLASHKAMRLVHHPMFNIWNSAWVNFWVVLGGFDFCGVSSDPGVVHHDRVLAMLPALVPREGEGPERLVRAHRLADLPDAATKAASSPAS